VKFKKEDIGLYFALSLVGAGAGLLVGALIAAKLTGPEPIFVPEWDDEDESEEVSAPKISRLEKLEKKDQISEDLETFIKKYEPSAIQIEMIKNDLITIEDLKESLIKEELVKQKKPYNYSTEYMYEEDDKPDLEELAQLPDEIEIIDERWQISSEQSTAKSNKNLRMVYYDVVDEVFFIMSRHGQPVPLTSVEEVVPNAVWYVVEPYLMSGMGPIFVNDLETVKHFQFEAVSEDLEESSDDNANS
jgi:hypothetical protein